LASRVRRRDPGVSPLVTWCVVSIGAPDLSHNLPDRDANRIDRGFSVAAVALELHTPTLLAFRCRRRCRVEDTGSDIAPSDYALPSRTGRSHFDAPVERKRLVCVYDFVARNTGGPGCARLALRSRSTLRSWSASRSRCARRSLRSCLVPGERRLRARATGFIHQTEISVGPVTSVDNAAGIRNCRLHDGRYSDSQANDQT
jgi:hypothetical protein